MAPRQIVVVENNALRRFMKKHGFCVSAAWLAEIIESEVKQAAELNEIYCAGLRVIIKRRNDQYFVTDIDTMEE